MKIRYRPPGPILALITSQLSVGLKSDNLPETHK